MNKMTQRFNVVLNKYFVCFSSSIYVPVKGKCRRHNTQTILLKTFEILATGSLLVMPTTEKHI